MVIGGINENLPPTASTFFYDRNEGDWITGPTLLQRRYGHAAGMVTDEETGEHFVAVTGGSDSEFLDSTEILEDGGWVQGKILDTTCYLLENTLVPK